MHPVRGAGRPVHRRNGWGLLLTIGLSISLVGIGPMTAVAADGSETPGAVEPASSPDPGAEPSPEPADETPPPREPTPKPDRTAEPARTPDDKPMPSAEPDATREPRPDPQPSANASLPPEALPSAEPSPVVAPSPAGGATDPTVRPRAVKVGPLLGTVGFRSAAPGLEGQYVTTHYRWNDSETRIIRDLVMRARSDPKPLLLELGLFRGSNGQFKLLGDNGRWVALDGGLFKANAASWADAWSFKAVAAGTGTATRVKRTLRALATSAESQPLLICLEAWKAGRQGLLTLDDELRLVVDPTITCGEGRTLFMTDDLPAGASVRDLLATPTTPVDKVTKVRFVPPDRPNGTLSGATRNDVLGDIGEYFFKLRNMNNEMFGGAESRLNHVLRALSPIGDLNNYSLPTKTDWWDVATQVLTGSASMFPGGTVYATAMKVTSQVAQFGFSYLENQHLVGPRIVPGVTNELLSTTNQIADEIGDVQRDTWDRLEDLEYIIREGCPRWPKPCANDRRLAQWLADPPLPRYKSSTFVTEGQFSYEREFWRRLLPLRATLKAKWSFIPSWTSAGGSRPFTLPEALGDSGTSGFGSPTWGDEILLFTSVWKPWANEKEVYEFPSYRTRYRPVAQAWTIGLVGSNGAIPMEPSYIDELFNPVNKSSPYGAGAGFGFSVRDVACTWLYNEPEGYWYWYSWFGEKHYTTYHPCNFGWYDLAAASPTRAIRGWTPWEEPCPAGGDCYPYWARDYDINTHALVWWVPDRKEVAAGRDLDDPDIFSWQIPHLKFSASCTKPKRSTAGGADETVYFANLTNGPISIAKVEANGSLTPVGSVARWDAIDGLYAANHRGDIPYAAGPGADGSNGIRHVQSHIGASYVVRATNGAGDPIGCVGTYTVEPAASYTCSSLSPQTAGCKHQVAEIHAHGAGNDGILDRN